MPNQVANVVKGDEQASNRVCGLPIEQQTMNKMQHGQAPFVLETVQNQNMHILPDQIEMQTQMGGNGAQMNQSYLMPLNPYMIRDIDDRYTSGSVDQGQIQYGLNINTNNHIQSNMAMTMQPHSHQLQAQQNSQQSSGANHVNMPMMWNTAENPYQQNLNTAMHNTGSEQICHGGDVNYMNMDVGNSNSQMIAQQTTTIQCQQCANHKCSNQQMMMASNTDLSGVNLTSLLVDCDLDEDQLVEYLAGCEPETQLYQLKNNSFPQQQNIYRQQI